MVKKLICIVLAACMLIAATQCVVFAKSGDVQVEEARKAINVAAKNGTVAVYNGMTMDEFLSSVAKALPDDSECKLKIEKEADYRISDATSEKDGLIFANITITCDVYSRKEMYDFKIPKLTGAAAEANANVEMIAEDIKSVKSYFMNKSLDYDVTAEDILEAVRPLAKNGSSIEWQDGISKVDSTAEKKGSVRGVLVFTLGEDEGTLKVSNTLKLLPEETQPQPDVDTPKNDDKEDETKTDIAAPAPVFSDVAASDYFADAVKWAVERKITNGTSDTTFSPNDTCTRAQIITFLWRAVGSPNPNGTNPYTDINANDYYYNAAVWAAEKGMVDGKAFAPNTPCTRASTVMYLWIAAGSPDCGTTDKFGDVSEYDDYAEAVAWAVENNVTSGTSDVTFSPDTICNRGQIVTFLKRAN